MKILKIHFKNINSLKGEHHIDFTEAPFNTSPLFAITGPTGSGKSTLLDVISLALFNQVPRLGKISKKAILAKGAILTRNQKEALASVTYQCNSGIFTSSWNISTSRNHTLRDYEMEIADEAGTILDFKKSRVPEENEKLIGLNYNQFVKSVLLAQGEFAQFLRAKKDERGELLEKITGTGIYRELGRKAYERFKTEARKIEKQQDEILTHQNELLDEAILEESQTAFKKKKEKIGLLETKIKKLEKNIELKESLVKTEKEIASAEKKQSTEKEKMAEFQERSGALLSGHEKVRPVADELRSWSSLQERLANLKRQLKNVSQNKEKNKQEIKTLLEAVDALIGKETDPEKVEKDIIGFSESVRALQKKRDVALAEYSKAQSVIKEQALETPFKYTPKADNLGKLELLKSDSEKKISEFSKLIAMNETDTVASLQEHIKKKLGRSQQLEKNEIALKQERKNLGQFSAEAGQVEAQRKALPKDMELAEANTKKFRAEADTLQLSLENQRLRASLKEHRSKLKKNAPCPLCGSLDHPFAGHLPKDSNTEHELDTLRKEYEKWNIIYISKKSDLAKLNEREKELKFKIASVSEDIKKLTDQEKKLSEGIALEPKATWESYTLKCQQQLDALTHLEKERRLLSIFGKLRPNLKKLEAIFKEGTEISTQLKQKYDGDNITKDTQELHTKWTELKKEQHLIDDLLRDTNAETQAKQVENRSLEKFLNQADSLTGFETVGEARKLLLDERTFNRLQAEKTEISNSLNRSDTTIKLLKKQLEAAKKIDIGDTFETLQDSFKTKRNELKIFREEHNELERKLINHKEKTEKIATLKQQIATEEKQIKRWKLLNELIGDAQGKRFNDFAQDLTLRHLVALANVRLADLSDRYRLDTPDDLEDDGLIALDDHMGGQRRSVKTLSGGETFLLSLSMALALSDLASSHVEINSLFIDEGFGTLDPETLDQTLDTLEKLQSESSKTIGIISHVDSLKERIATQIQLERNGQGYSTLRVV